MSITNGRSIVELYHPLTDENYTFIVDWTYYFSPAVHTLSNGDPGYPEESSLDWIAKLTHIEGVITPEQNELPDWVTIEMIEEQLDLSDVLEPDYD